MVIGKSQITIRKAKAKGSLFSPIAYLKAKAFLFSPIRAKETNMRIESKDIRGYRCKFDKEEKELCPDCFGLLGEVPARKDDIITDEDIERDEHIFCDECGIEF